MRVCHKLDKCKGNKIEDNNTMHQSPEESLNEVEAQECIKKKAEGI
jgi:hypothetical protein